MVGKTCRTLIKVLHQGYGKWMAISKELERKRLCMKTQVLGSFLLWPVL